MIITIALPRHLTDRKLAPVQQELLRRVRLDYTDLLDLTLRHWQLHDELNRHEQLDVLMDVVLRRVHRDHRADDYAFVQETAALLQSCLSLTRANLEPGLRPLLEQYTDYRTSMHLKRFVAGLRMIPIAELEVGYAR